MVVIVRLLIKEIHCVTDSNDIVKASNMFNATLFKEWPQKMTCRLLGLLLPYNWTSLSEDRDRDLQ